MHEDEQEFSFKEFFTSLTTLKVVHIIVILGLIVFGNMLFNGFVWDDKTFIILNPDVYSMNLPYLLGTNLFNDTVYYRPIPAVYFTALYTTFTTAAFPYHLLQLILHIVNTFLLFKLFSSFFKKELSLFLCLIFLVHPMQVESVSYIAQTVSPLFFLFGISALLYLKKNQKNPALWKINIFLLLSLLTKETGIIYIFLVNIYTYLYKRSKLLLIAAASGGALLVYFLIRFFIGHVFFAKSLLVTPIANLTLAERLLSVPSVIFYYFKTFFFPLNLGINQHWIITSVNFQSFYFPLLVDLLILFLIGALGYYCFKKSQTLFQTFIFFASWLLLGLLTHSQIVPLDMTVADRWFYTTMVGLLGLLGLAFEVLVKDRERIKKVLIVLGIVVICLLSIRTIERNTDWSDALKLYNHDIKIDDNFDIENSLSWEYIQSKQYDLAIQYAKRSIQFWPEWDKSWYNLGVAYHFSGNTSSAKAAYEKALQHNSDNVQVQENLGYLLLYYYDAKDAKVLLTKALEKHPQRSKLWLYLALANYKLGDKTEALRSINNAYALNPADADIVQVYNLITTNSPINFQK